MRRIGLICPAATGHLNTMLPLGAELARRGNRVTLFGFLDAQAQTLRAGLEFHPLGEARFPEGALTKAWRDIGKQSGLAALSATIGLIRDLASVTLQEGPEAAEGDGIDGLVVDQVSVAGGTIADRLNIPFVTLCSAVVLNQDIGVPPALTGWRYDPSRWGRLRNALGYSAFNRLVRPISKLVAEYRRRWNLPIQAEPNEAFSQLAQISQEPAEFEFPRTGLPLWFHFTGPFHASIGRPEVTFPFERLTDRPLIYASLGSIINQRLRMFKVIAAACQDLDAQLVISLGGSSGAEALAGLPGSPLVVEYAPQLELLPRAALTVSHAGLNTSLESLACGVPVVAIPICNDQPGVAARLAWTGAGAVLPMSRASAPRLRTIIERVLTVPSYKQHALRLQRAIATSGGVGRAADIAERAILHKRPVT